MWLSKKSEKKSQMTFYTTPLDEEIVPFTDGGNLSLLLEGMVGVPNASPASAVSANSIARLFFGSSYIASLHRFASKDVTWQLHAALAIPPGSEVLRRYYVYDK